MSMWWHHGTLQWKYDSSSWNTQANVYSTIFWETKNHNMIIIIHHRKKNGKMQLTPSICWCSEGLERFGEILTRREALLISTKLKKRLFLKKDFFFLLFFLMHFLCHYLILNRVSMSWSRNKTSHDPDIRICWNDSTLH